MTDEAKILLTPPVFRGQGVTPAERFLGALCKDTFLSLWSYPCVYRDQLVGGQGQEVADLLVVCGADIIIFADKHCTFSPRPDIAIGWRRWVNRALRAGARQLRGAHRWLEHYPDRIFLDKGCKHRFPYPLPTSPQYHLVLVTHGISNAIRQHLGGNGSLIINNRLQGLEAHNEPFTVGDLDPALPFIHVLDDTTLQILLSERDTITDLTTYLRKKESFLRTRHVTAAGEEELLAIYYQSMNDDGEHDFVIPGSIDGQIILTEGFWQSYRTSETRAAKKEADEDSYRWDDLIEGFNTHLLNGTHYLVTNTTAETESVLRFLAREPRIRRRMLAETLLTQVRDIPRTHRGVRVVPPSFPDEPYYAFLTFPAMPERNEVEYRKIRAAFLDALLRVVKLKFPQATDIVGIATEAGLLAEPRTEDLAYLDARRWTDEDERDAIGCQEHTRLLTNDRVLHLRAYEFPPSAGPSPSTIEKNPRNKPCPCGSNKKYKHCHGR